MSPQRELNAVVQAAMRGATVLTGNTRASRFLLAECDRLLEQSAQAWKTPDILPLATWVQRTFREAQIASATDLVLLNHRQSLSLWKRSITESAGISDLFLSSNVSGQALQAWDRLHAYRIQLNSSFEVTAQSMAFAGWAKRYKQITAQRKFTDAAQVSDEVAKVVSAGILLPKDIHLWRCGDLTPQHADLVQILQSAGVAIVTHEFEEATWEHAQRIACDDSESELRRAASYARSTLKHDPESRVGIVLLKLREQRAKAEAVFTEILHPEFYVGEEGQRSFEISLGEPLGSHALVRTALTLLRFAVGDLKFQEVRELLMSPYLSGADKESAERARLCKWLGERAHEQISVQRLLKVLRPTEPSARAAEELKGIAVPKLRQTLAQLARPEGMPTKAAMSDWVTRLGQLLRLMGWPGEEDKKLSSPNFQAYTKWLELLSDLASLDVTQGPVTLREAVDEIVSAAASQTFAPENLGAPVQIMDDQEAEGSLFDHLWVCGLDDETWPRKRVSSPLIPAQLLRAAKVPGSTPESQTEEARKNMSRLLGSAARTVLSYPLQDADRKLRMSPGIASAQGVDWTQMNIEIEPTWLERMSGIEVEELTDVNAPPVTDAELMHRGSSLLERQSACPFKAFAELRLGATDVNEPVAGIDPKVRGNLIEDVLEAFWQGARDLENLRGFSADDRKTLIARSVDQALQKHLGESETPAEITIREIERERLEELTSEWLELEDKRSAFDQVRHQQHFEYEVAGVRLKGRIDRIDRSITHLGEVVIDYKTGTGTKYTKNSWETPRPRMPQLPLYAAYLQGEGKNVVGVGFGILNTAKSKVEGMASSKVNFGNNQRMPKWAKPTLGEQITAWAEEIERLVKEHLAGAAQVDPKVPPSKSSSPCEHCHLHAMCRVAEMTEIDGDDEEYGDE